MNVSQSINFSSLSNVESLKNSEANNIKNFSPTEVFSFSQNKIKQDEIYETMGVKISSIQNVSRNSRQKAPDFDKAVEYYNTLGYYERSEISTSTYKNLEECLYKMEHDIDQAFIDCDAYKDITIVPRGYYKYYPYIDTRLINFDIAEIRNLTTKDMDSLHTLKDKVETIIEEANGETEHNTPEKTEYDVELLAQKHLKMSFEEFYSKYKDEVEFCKTVTSADLISMNETQRMVYSKLKAYAADMLQTTINEAHVVNWDAGERKVNEALKTTDDIFIILDFESNGITEDGLENFKSGISFKAFEESLISAYHSSSDIQEIKLDDEPKTVRKQIVNGSVLIFTPDGSIYDTTGKRIK